MKWLGWMQQAGPRGGRAHRVLTAVWVVVVIAIATALSTWIDPALHPGSPMLAQGVNAVLPLIVVLLVWAISGRAWIALLVEVALLGVLRYANEMKLLYLHTDVVYADFTVLAGLLKDPHLVLGFLHPKVGHLAIGAVVLVAAILAGWFTRHARHAGWKFRVACLVVAVAGGASVALVRAQDVITSLHWQVYQQAFGANDVGVAGNILLGRMTARDVDRAPDPKAERAFWADPAVRRAEAKVGTAGSSLRPDIVIVQSESMFEPSQLCGFANTPVLKHVAQQQPDLPGNLHVPVFGGRTLQTEFEVLSGAPIAFYPGSMFAYYGIVKHRFDALPDVLDHAGYRTIAIHPNQRGFWRRGVVFPEMGFQTFQDINSFRYPQDFSERGLVSDYAFTRAILAELDASNRPTFVMGISINNHGPWGKYAPKSDVGLGLPPKLHGRGRRALADYVEHAIDADNAYGFLLDALKRRGRPTVVVFYGDHMPALPRVYKNLCFKNGKSAQKHYPPYRIWANFPMPSPPAVTSAYLLQGWLMHVAQLPLKGHVLANYLAGVVAHDPQASAAEKKRVLSEYANIAAANVDERAPPTREGHPVFIDYQHALPTLVAHRVGAGGDPSVKYDHLHFRPDHGQPVKAVFDLGGDVASLTLRPYLSAADLACAATGSAVRAAINVTGDGRELYRATLAPQSFRLATLDVQGVKRLAITVTGGSEEGARNCSAVVVKVPQMLCFSARCNRPGPPLPPGSPAASPSRILARDPMPGDIAHLASMLPLARRHVAGKMANLQWMLSHQTAEQVGDVALSVQHDAQLFMPPAQDHAAWIAVDVHGLERVVLSPRVRKMTDKCLRLDAPSTRVGIADVSVTLDGRPLVAPFKVDQHYRKLVDLDVKGGHTLKIIVTKGSSVDWCDWFSVGFPTLEGPALQMSAATAQTAAAGG